MATRDDLTLGAILVKTGRLRQSQLDVALKDQRKHEPLGQTLLRLGLLEDESEIDLALKGQATWRSGRPTLLNKFTDEIKEYLRTRAAEEGKKP